MMTTRAIRAKAQIRATHDRLITAKIKAHASRAWAIFQSRIPNHAEIPAKSPRNAIYFTPMMPISALALEAQLIAWLHIHMIESILHHNIELA